MDLGDNWRDFRKEFPSDVCGSVGDLGDGIEA